MRARLIGRTGRSAGTDFSIDGESWIGASPEVDLRMAIEGVSRRHARLWPRGESFWLEDNDSTNGTFVNGQRVDRVRLRHLDVVTLGRDLDLIFLQREGELPGARRRAIRRATLEWLEGPDVEVGSRVEIASGTTTLGRDWSCTVNVEAGTVSKVHASIKRHADHLTLQDLKSTNGTKVNGHRVEETRVLEDGDVIQLASAARLRVHVETDPDVEPSTPPRETVEPEVFDQEWKTLLIWAPGEMEGIGRVHAGRGAEDADEPDEPREPKKAAKPEPAEKPKRSKPSEKAKRSKPSEKAKKSKPSEKVEAAPEQPDATEVELAPKEQASQRQPGATEVEPAPEGPAATEVESTSGERAATEVEPTSRERAATEVEATPRGESATEVQPSGQAAVTGVRLVGDGASYALEAGRSVIGRSDDCDVMLDGTGISRQHAAIEWIDEGVWVKDLGSVNGTRLNGELLEERHRLRHGDRLSFVDVELEVELEGEGA